MERFKDWIIEDLKIADDVSRLILSIIIVEWIE